MTLRVLTYNVWALPWLLPWPFRRPMKRFHNMLGALGELGVDILCLQELFDPQVKSLFVRRLSKRFPYWACGPAAARFSIDSGLMIFSRFPIVEHDSHMFSVGSGFDRLASKGVLRARIALNKGYTLDCFNVHLNAGEDVSSATTRQTQMKELRRWMDKSSGPLILAGDFNCEPQNSGFRTNDTNEPTWHSGKERRSYDHIFTRGGLTLVKKQVVLGCLTSSCFSDHFGVLAQIKVRN